MTDQILERLDEGADRRVRKTKKALREALFSLIKTKTINQITVKELTDLADVNRSTFYLYYTDVFDMFEKIQNEIYALFSRVIIPFEYNPTDSKVFAKYIKRFLTFCKENPEVCKFIFRNGTNNDVAMKIKASIVDMAPDSHRFFAQDDPRFHLTTFALSGMIFATIEWVETGMQSDTDKFAEFLADVYIYGAVYAKDHPSEDNS